MYSYRRKVCIRPDDRCFPFQGLDNLLVNLKTWCLKTTLLTLIISHIFFGPETWEGLGWVILAHSLS